MQHLQVFLFLLVGVFSCGAPELEEEVISNVDSATEDSLSTRPFVSISLDKQNIAYIGFDNPISINTYGLNPWLFEITTSPGATFRGGGRGGILRVLDQGAPTITVRYKGQVVEEFTVRAKYISNPTAYLGNNTSGEIDAENFKAQRGIYAPIMNMDIDATCRITGYRLLRVSASNDRSRSRNKGGNFDASTLPLIQQAAPGDIYQFTGVKAKCPGDKVSRQLNPLAFEIR